MATGGLTEGNNGCHHGYKCITKEETTPDFQCISCRNILRKPSLTACCDQNFCSDFLKDKNGCPSCGKELHYGLNRYLNKQVQKLSVICTQRTHGCDWEGEITDLDEHMSLCEYVQVPCNKCDQKVGKRQLQAHLSDECPEREYLCPHCGFKDTHSFVTRAHFPICSNAPVTCPNGCGEAGERDNMENHLENECPLHFVECSFRQAGCMQKFRRENRGKHMQASIGPHLASLANFTFKMNKKVEELALKRLEGEGNEDNGEEEEADMMTAAATSKNSRKEAEISNLNRTVNMLLERVNSLPQIIAEEVSTPENVTENVKIHKELEKKLQEKEDKIQQLRNSLEDHNTSQMELEKRLAMVEKTLNNNTQLQDAPAALRVTFDLKGFEARKGKKEQWTSPIFNNYDKQNQYKLKVVVWPNGQRKGKDTHVSVWLEQEVGELTPPAHIFVIFELLNQLNDGHHIEANSHFDLTNQRYIGVISNQLIKHSQLEYDPLERTQYLVEDTLKFRIQVCIVKKNAS